MKNIIKVFVIIIMLAAAGMIIKNMVDHLSPAKAEKEKAAMIQELTDTTPVKKEQRAVSVNSPVPKNQVEDDALEDTQNEVVVLEYPAKVYDHAKADEINPDYIGMIYIPSVGIEYPLVSAEDTEYYLEHDFTGAKSSSGSIFMDSRSNLESDGHCFIYGHHMKNNAMFGRLDEEFLNQDDHHLYIYTENGDVLVYDCVSAYITDTQDKIYSGSMNREEFIEDITNKNILETVASTEGVQQYVTLQACHGAAGSGGRFLAHFALQGKVEQ